MPTTRTYRQQAVKSICGEREYRFVRLMSLARPFVAGSMRTARLSTGSGKVEVDEDDITFQAFDHSSPIHSEN